MKAILLTVVAATAVRAAEPSAADLDFFEKRVRPVLVEHCHECHAEKKQKGGLRLDSLAAALAGGDLGPALVPGDAAKSLLIKAVGYEDEELQMPPKKRLSDAQIADLAEWVKRGAPWPGGAAAVAATKESGRMVFSDAQRAHWAFQPVRKPAVPRPQNDAWCQTDIDRFILAKLEAANLRPAPPADARTLLRRLSFDLTGLPPTAEEAARFVDETGGTNRTSNSQTSSVSNSSYQSAIKRLLASPHHGERYARHWLDVARYADSNGSDVDHTMANAWRYRDYVVAALNGDMPFDQFLREQVAGDLLNAERGTRNAEPPEGSALAASGFLMLGPKALAELDKPKLAADIVDEQVDTVGRAFMGLTLGCARCHDHKFDPIGDEDYYALAGIFSSTRTMVDITKRLGTWNERPIGPPEDGARIATLLERIASLQKRRDAMGSGGRVKHRLTDDDPFLVIEAEDFARGNLRVDADQLGRGIGVLRTRLEYPDHVEYEFEVESEGEYQLELRYAAKESRPVELSLNGNLEDMNAAAEVTGEWNPGAQRWFMQGAYRLRAGANKLAFHRDGPVPLFDKLLIGKVSAEPHSRNVPAAPAEKPEADADVKKVNALKKKIDGQVADAQKELETIPTVMAPFDGPVADAPILIRGNPATPGDIVPRGYARIVGDLDLPTPGAEQSGRLELARWLTHPDHPLTARVIVNRVWQWHFGEGLVRSPDNFGLRGEKPSHPELLDWLAAWFVENGWSLKKLHALICSSAVYQQGSNAELGMRNSESSNAPPSDIPQSEIRNLKLADPENRLLSHFPRRRLSAEELRDAMLAVTGELDPALGGTVMTVMNRTYAGGGNAPGNINSQMHYDTTRRSLYLPVIRTALHDFFAVFDYPDPGMLTGRRDQTTVAPQALFLMNSPFVKARAAALAKRVLSSAGTEDTARVQAAYQSAFGRAAAADEVKAALAYIAAESEEGNPAGPQAAWTRLCHSLLISNEFLHVR